MPQPVLRSRGLQLRRVLRLLERIRGLGLFFAYMSVWPGLGGSGGGDGRCTQRCGVLQYGLLRRVRPKHTKAADYAHRHTPPSLVYVHFTGDQSQGCAFVSSLRRRTARRRARNDGNSFSSTSRGGKVILH